ncbi:hypothetical protein SAMN05444161_1640 [Rhizobiales bacterium GAS191]|nr:hypothetical protein SAMN05519104_1678 [Rhizobiales bacterium GAS188]SEC69216.1 hypothetical protein SAMN05444161_1640 [Rhizobiales bacterium GAS191]
MAAIQNIAALHAAVAAVCPIVGVGGDGAIFYDPINPATAAQKTAAQAVVAGWVDPVRPREATGKQICAALSDLGLLAAWDAAVMASTKPEDRAYWLNSYRAAVPENSPKIARIASRVGVTISALFTKALTEPAV